MIANSRLVLYGNSVFLAGIKAELEHNLALEPVTVEAGCPDAANLVIACNPSAVLFDLHVALPDFAAILLRERPGLLLIGVDSSSNELLILSARPQQAFSMSDLIEVIHNKEPNSETHRGGNHDKDFQS